MIICIFCGPTITGEEGLGTLDAIWLPPVRQGDVYRAVGTHFPGIIGIIDGHFLQAPAIWHKEILWAMDQGVHVFGAASMGALRAAELDSFGMVGVGKIYQSYCTGSFEPYGSEQFEDDDEVAIVHGPSEVGYVAGSEALVNIRETMARASSDGVIDNSERDCLIKRAKTDYFQQRSYTRLLNHALEEGFSDAHMNRLREWLVTNTINLKKKDALELLVAIREFAETRPGPKKVRYAFQHTDIWTAAIGAMDERDSWFEVRQRLLDISSKEST